MRDLRGAEANKSHQGRGLHSASPPRMALSLPQAQNTRLRAMGKPPACSSAEVGAGLRRLAACTSATKLGSCRGSAA